MLRVFTSHIKPILGLAHGELARGLLGVPSSTHIGPDTFPGYGTAYAAGCVCATCAPAPPIVENSIRATLNPVRPSAAETSHRTHFPVDSPRATC
jgi:hypothetical protein